MSDVLVAGRAAKKQSLEVLRRQGEYSRGRRERARVVRHHAQRRARHVRALATARECQGVERGLGDSSARGVVQRGCARRFARRPRRIGAFFIFTFADAFALERGERRADGVERLGDQRGGGGRAGRTGRGRQADAQEPPRVRCRLRARRHSRAPSVFFFSARDRVLLLLLPLARQRSVRRGRSPAVVHRGDDTQDHPFDARRVRGVPLVILAQLARQRARLVSRRSHRAEPEKRRQRRERSRLHRLLRPAFRAERAQTLAHHGLGVRLDRFRIQPGEVPRDELEQLRAAGVGGGGRLAARARILQVAKRTRVILRQEHRGRGGELVRGEMLEDLLNLLHQVRGCVVRPSRARGNAVQALQQVAQRSLHRRSDLAASRNLGCPGSSVPTFERRAGSHRGDRRHFPARFRVVSDSLGVRGARRRDARIHPRTSRTGSRATRA